ncbi:hypothetical protein [Shewanella sediminis]|nr:hypothetical protein [Shewanella sediminis]
MKIGLEKMLNNNESNRVKVSLMEFFKLAGRSWRAIVFINS